MSSSARKIAKLGGVFSDLTRVRILRLLFEKGQATTMDITTTLRVLQPRASSHLAVLLNFGLVSVIGRGRQRIYTLDPIAVRLLQELGKLSEESTSNNLPKEKMPRRISRAAEKEIKENSALRQCRTCYDHLAGVEGINLLSELVRLGWLSRKPASDNKSARLVYALTPVGSHSLRGKSVDIDRATGSKRTFAYGCMDWTERVPHLGGSLGCAILDSILAQRIVSKISGTRALKILRPISSWVRS